MKYLTLIRHAKSAWDDPELPDLVRPLNARGKAAVPKMAQALKERKVTADLILCSPATRALHTALGFCSVLNYAPEKIEVEPVLYYGNIPDIMAMFRQLPDAHNSVLLFGHEPLLSHLIDALTGACPEKFPTCAMLQIAFPVKAWNAIKQGKAVFMLTPREL